MPRDLADLADSVHATATALQRADRVAVEKAALATTKTIRASIRRATGGDSRLSGAGRAAGGSRVGARYELKRTREVKAEITATGPLQLIEGPTQPHRIWPKGYTYARTARGGARRRGKNRALKFDGRFASGAWHPGTPGKAPFAKGWAAARPKVPGIVRRELGKTITKAWS